MDEEQELEKITEGGVICYGIFALGADVAFWAINFLSGGIGVAITAPAKTGATWWLNRWLKNKHTWLPSGAGQWIIRILGANLSLFVLLLVLGWLHNNQERLGTVAKAFKATEALKAAAGTKGLGAKVKAAREAYATNELTP
ncbi:MAG: hypothetical protein AAB884_02490 [Patescibacteria group bacterium]